MTDRPDPPEFDLQGFTSYQLAVAAQKLSEELSRQYRARFGISVPEWRVLAHLTQADGVSVRDILARVAMEKSKVSRAANRLEKAGLIVKLENEQDRRLVHLHLAEKGRALMADLLPLAAADQRDLDARLGETRAGFEAGLDRLLAED